ncbi:hypothetical protein BD289DRAFT_74878 [Coniella lustricola]|uniref:Uncharacterized protein n=1 Tax=Coniella lustricola TaxID=2025994 RepID=A0A2T3AHS8_9PEZI|nr:hypothetical protein BD289DRAFT_74878 [Coniella lustricola]
MGPKQLSHAKALLRKQATAVLARPAWCLMVKAVGGVRAQEDRGWLAESQQAVDTTRREAPMPSLYSATTYQRRNKAGRSRCGVGGDGAERVHVQGLPGRTWRSSRRGKHVAAARWLGVEMDCVSHARTLSRAGWSGWESRSRACACRSGMLRALHALPFECEPPEHRALDVICRSCQDIKIQRPA